MGIRPGEAIIAKEEKKERKDCFPVFVTTNTRALLFFLGGDRGRQALFLENALGAVPGTTRFGGEANTLIVKPFEGTVLAVTGDHFTKGHLAADAVDRLLWVGPVPRLLIVQLPLPPRRVFGNDHRWLDLCQLAL